MYHQIGDRILYHQIGDRIFNNVYNQQQIKFITIAKMTQVLPLHGGLQEELVSNPGQSSRALPWERPLARGHRVRSRTQQGVGSSFLHEWPAAPASGLH
jgi:hypothetical protein